MHKKRRATIHTLGCRLNQAESHLIRDQLEQAGYAIVPFEEEADLAILNTCTVTSLADAKCRNAIRSFTRRNPEAFVAVVGCYSRMNSKAVADIPGVDLILGTHEKLNILDYVAIGKSERPLIVRDRIDKADFTISFAGDQPFPKRANLKIQDGCDFMCSFCVIPFARGRARSRDMKNLLDEARSLAERGAREFVLTGVNIGAYRFDGATTLDVIGELNNIPGVDRIRIGSIEPTTIPTQLFAWMNDPDHALLPSIHIPLQSGSDKILKRMRRKYSVNEYIDFIRRASDAVDDLYIGTDIMVGFPGETEEDFQETCRVFLDQPFAFCHVFTFSEREGTAAASATDQVPIPERHRRGAHLRRLSASRRRDFHARHIGRTMRVLFEDPKPGAWPAYTDNYIRVAVPSASLPDPTVDLRNRTALVTLEKPGADFVEGKLVKMLD